jgi:hypothetical protein
METLRGFSVPSFPGHELAVLAVERLTREAGLSSLGGYYEGTARQPWPEAFDRAFGRSPATFYREFEAERRDVTLPG